MTAAVVELQLERPEQSLATYLNEVAGAIRRAGPRAAWVRCEVTRITPRPGGQVYLQLAEADATDAQARAQAVIWQERAASVLGHFAMETGTALADGMRILLLVAPHLSARWGFGLTVLDIDPAWTVGQSRLLADAIRQRLSKEGIWERNRTLAEPEDFTSVAVIAPDRSAGLEDFKRDAGRLEAMGLCGVSVLSVPFEGPGAAKAVGDAISFAGRNLDHDAVFVIRGGGAVASISWLDAEDAVRAACLCPVPVITGIGHESDRVLLDEVANMSFGTPSKAVRHLCDTVVDRAEDARAAWTDVKDAAVAALSAGRASIDALLREAVGLSPTATLERGYAIVLAGGSAVTSAGEASRHPRLEARFRDGTLPIRPMGEVARIGKRE